MPNDIISIDMSDVLKGIPKLMGVAVKGLREGLSGTAEELMRLGNQEVPFDKGTLMQSGDVDDSGLLQEHPEIVVGYNTPYAARLHEHPEYHFKNGRKGKFLEDPLKRNLQTFRDFIAEKIKAAL